MTNHTYIPNGQVYPPNRCAVCDHHERNFVHSFDPVAVAVVEGRPHSLIASRNTFQVLATSHGIALSGYAKPIRTLRCTCCGESFQGRQFHNQDTGYGMGPCCADRVLAHRPFGHEPMTLADFERTYGKRGIHFEVAA